MKHRELLRLLFGALSLAIGAGSLRAENWPTWRGPANDGVSKETGLPTTWSETKNVVWKLPMPGLGGATPIVWGDRIFITSAAGADLVMVCADTAGTKLWTRKIGASARGAIRKDEGNEASASPCTDGKHVYAFVGSGDFVCFDFKGDEVWKFNAQTRYGRFSIQHGLHNTPILHEDRLYMVLLHNNGHWVIALDKATGKEVWKAERKTDAKGESREAYSSPCLWQNGDKLQLVVLGCDYTTGHDLKDGAEAWRLGDLNPKVGYSNAFRIIASPVASPDLLVVPTARGGIMVAMKPGASGFVGAGTTSEQWRKVKGAPDVPSPLVVEGVVYLPRENGVLQCWDAKTAKVHYEERLHADRYRASPAYADGKVYVTSRDGTFSVVKVGPEFKLLATNNLDDTFTASPVFSGGRIYLRGFKHLYAIGESSK